MKIGSIILGAAALALGSAAANGQTVVVKSNPLPSERVGFADLNLYSAAGKATLDRRIRGAARRVCMEPADRSIGNLTDGRLCFAAAVADGHRQMTEVIAGGRVGTGLATATLTIRAQ